MILSANCGRTLFLCVILLFSNLVFSQISEQKTFDSSLVKDKIKQAYAISFKDSTNAKLLIDKVITYVEKSKDRSILFDAYVARTKILTNCKDFDGALLSANQALMLALEMERETQISQAYELISKTYLVKEYKAESLEYLYKGLALSEQLNDTSQLKWYYTTIPLVEFELGKLANSLENSLKSIDFLIEKKDSLPLAKSYQLIGLIHSELGNFKLSQTYLSKCTVLFNNLKNPLEIGITYSILAKVLYSSGNIDESEKYVLRASEILAKYQSTIFYQNQTLLGTINSSKGNLSEALKLFHNSIENQSKLKDFAGLASSYLELGELYLKQNNFEQSIEAFDSCVKISKVKNLIQLTCNAYKGLSYSYGNSGNISNAYKYLNLYGNFTDSLLNIQKVNEANNLENQYEIKKKEKEIMLQNIELSLNSERIKESRQKQILLYLIILLALGVMVFAYRESRLKKRANIDLTFQKTEIEAQKQIVEKRNRDITDSLNYAQRIQQAILKSSLQLKEFFNESFILFIPKDIVSGDFYWVKSKNNKLLFAMADCTGHGVPGAFMSIIGTYGLNNLVNELDMSYPGEILNEMSDLFKSSFDQIEGAEIFDGMDIGLCLYDPATKELNFAGANLPLHILRENSKPQASSHIMHKNESFTLYQIKPNKQPIGFIFEETNYVTHGIKLLEGDIVYMFTDGFADQFGGLYTKKFRYQELRHLICSIADLPLEEQKRKLETTFVTWKGDNIQVDDVSFMGIKIS
jgi:serine phosphatase RsbU (regulator of sigma subunit)